MINLAADGEKDGKGKTLLKRARVGEVNWSTESSGQGNGRILVSQRERALARNFSCGTQVGMCGIGPSISVLDVLIDSSGDMGPAIAQMCIQPFPVGGCGGTYDYSKGGSATWSWQNTSIATVGSTGTVTGVGGGLAYIDLVYSSGGCTFGGQGQAPVRVPKSLDLQTGSYTWYDGQAYQKIPHYYGYSQTETYTVLDQNTHVLAMSGMTANESVTVVSSNPSGVVNSSPGPITVNAKGQFLDYQSFGFTTPPLPQPGEYVKTKQTISITAGGKSYQVRINCIDAEYNAVTITDVTANPSATCK